VTWLAAVQVVTARCGGDPARLAALGLEEFTALVRAAVPGWGGKRGWGRICRRVFAALTDTEGVVAWSRRGLLRRVADELGDLARTRAQLRAVEADMVMVLGELGLSRLGDIPGLTAVGAAASWPRPATRAATTVRHPWSSMPGCPRPRTPRAPLPVRRTSPAAAGPGGGSRGPRAARQGPRRVRRLLAALDLLHDRPRHQLGRRGRLRRRRLPARPALPAGGSLTRASIRPHRCGCP
jgi:hypothetical protein